MAIRIDGKGIANIIKQSLIEKMTLIDRDVIFSIIYVGQDPVIDNFIKYKKEFGQDIGVIVNVHSFDADIDQDTLCKEILNIEKQSDGMIVQLPLPKHLNTQIILDTVPAHKDIDVLSSQAKSFFRAGYHDMYPPVTGAMVEVLKSQDFDIKDKNIVLVGYGNLVGKPFGDLLDTMEIPYDVIDKNTLESEKQSLLMNADMVVAGAGMPGLITADMIQSDVVLLDGGTSEAGKRVVGDIDPSCYESSLFYTPVPGGIGPITIAVLYRNFITAVLDYDK